MTYVCQEENGKKEKRLFSLIVRFLLRGNLFIIKFLDKTESGGIPYRLKKIDSLARRGRQGKSMTSVIHKKLGEKDKAAS
jgi:hypothetical protein